MKIVHLVRPALAPDRELEARVRDAQCGLRDFVMGACPPAGWLAIEILPDEAGQDTSQAPASTRISRR